MRMTSNFLMSLVLRTVTGQRRCLRSDGSISRMVVVDMQSFAVGGHTNGDDIPIPDCSFQELLSQREEHICLESG